MTSILSQEKRVFNAVTSNSGNAEKNSENVFSVGDTAFELFALKTRFY